MKNVTHQLRRWAVLPVAGVLLIGTPLAPAAADSITYTVESTADLPAGPNAVNMGRCFTGSDGLGPCTLRAAIEVANGRPAGNSITITVPAGTYPLSRGFLGVIPRSALTITGTGADLTLVQQTSASGPVFSIQTGGPVIMVGLTIAGARGSGIDMRLPSGVPGPVALDALTIRDNSAYGISGVGELEVSNTTIRNNQGGGLAYFGGGGVLTVTGSSITGNTSRVDGGGMFINPGPVNIRNSTISGNTASRGGGIALGGGGGTLSLTASTVSGNNVTGQEGGGLWVPGAGTAMLTNSTVSGNNAPRGGGIFTFGSLTLTNVTAAYNSSGIEVVSGGNVVLRNSIVANSTSADCNVLFSGILTSLDFNLDSDGSCGLNQPNDVPATNPLLAPLANNGGPTQTHALDPASPAVDAGGDATNSCPTADQRGVTRPQGPACDIGAFELEQFVASPVQTKNSGLDRARNRSARPSVPPLRLPQLRGSQANPEGR